MCENFLLILQRRKLIITIKRVKPTMIENISVTRNGLKRVLDKINNEAGHNVINVAHTKDYYIIINFMGQNRNFCSLLEAITYALGVEDTISMMYNNNNNNE